MKKELISIKDVKKTYFIGNVKVEALRGVFFSVKENDFIAIMGPSGSGKSTLLHLCGLLDKPTHGHMFVEGHSVSHLTSDQLATIRNKKIGFIFQQFNLIPYLNTVENVCLPCLFSENKEYVKVRAIKLLERVGLKGKERNRPTELSGGEQQRVAIARALINDPDIILADEPTGNLDSKTGKQIMDILVDLHKQGKTLVIVTHDPVIAKYARTLTNIRDGLIIGDHQKAQKYLWSRNKNSLLKK